VHSPFQPAPASDGWDSHAHGATTSQPKYFADTIANLDGVVGQIVAELTVLRLCEQTLVFFLGDNGTDRALQYILARNPAAARKR